MRLVGRVKLGTQSIGSCTVIENLNYVVSVSLALLFLLIWIYIIYVPALFTVGELGSKTKKPGVSIFNTRLSSNVLIARLVILLNVG